MKLWVRFQILCFILFSALYAEKTSLQNEEDLFFQRIEEAYHKSDDISFFSYVYKYIKMYPNTEKLNRLYALSADVFYRKQDFHKVVQIYEMISSEEIRKDVQVNYLASQYGLGNYEIVVDQVTGENTFSEQEEDLLLKSFKKILFDKERDNHVRYGYLQRAISFYESASSTPHRLTSLASYYFMLQKFSKAASTLRKAALLDLDLKSKEEILFQLSNVQVYFSHDHAIKTLNKVCSIGGSFKPTAAYNKLVLSFKNNCYKQIIQEKDFYKCSLQESHFPFFHYVLGVCYLFKEEFTQAEDDLLTFLTNKGEYGFLEEDALFYLGTIANKKNGCTINCQIEEKSSHQNLALLVLPEHKQLELFAVHKDYEKDKDYKRGEQRKKELVMKAENNEEKMLSHFELALFYFDKKNWKEARNSFYEFLQQYSDYSLQILAWDYLIQSSTQLTENDDDFAKAKLIYDLENFLTASENNLTKSEAYKYRLLLAKTQYQTGAFEEAIETVQALIEKDPPKKVLSSCLALMAYSYRFGFQDQEKFSALMEKALEAEPNMDHSVYLLH